MRLSQVVLPTVAAAVCCAGLWAFQRTADFGFGDDDSPSNVKAEFYWSRLAYPTGMASFGALGGRGHWGGLPGRAIIPRQTASFLSRCTGSRVSTAVRRNRL